MTGLGDRPACTQGCGVSAAPHHPPPRPEPEPTVADRAHPVCPDCGHHTSAWVGSGCTVLLPATDVEIAAGQPWVRVCGHDCTISLYGESMRDQLARAFRTTSNHPLTRPADGGPS